MFTLTKVKYIDFPTILDFKKWCFTHGVPVWVNIEVFWSWLGTELELEIPVFKEWE